MTFYINKIFTYNQVFGKSQRNTFNSLIEERQFEERHNLVHEHFESNFDKRGSFAHMINRMGGLESEHPRETAEEHAVHY